MGVWILILGFRGLKTEETQCTDKSDAILYGSVVPKRVETVLIKKLCTYRIMICLICYCCYCCILTQSWCCDFVPFYPVQTSFLYLVLASPLSPVQFVQISLTLFSWRTFLQQKLALRSNSQYKLLLTLRSTFGQFKAQMMWGDLSCIAWWLLEGSSTPGGGGVLGLRWPLRAPTPL